jgi:ankyrin repeat protein
MRGHSSIIDMLIKAGCDVNALDKNKWSPLMCACYWANPEAVVYLNQFIYILGWTISTS